MNWLDLIWLNWFDFIPLCLNRKFQNMLPYFGRLDGWNIPLAKVVDFVPLGALFGPGAPDPDLDHFQCNLDSGRMAYWWTGWDIENENVNISLVFQSYLNWEEYGIHKTIIFTMWLKHCDSMSTRRNCKFLILHETWCIYCKWLEYKCTKPFFV